MSRILLVLIIVAAVSAVLWSSWRLDRRLFAAMLTASVTLLVLFAAGFFQSQERTFEPLPASDVELQLLRWRATESGVRLEGRVHNKGARPIARLSGTAVLRNCPETDNCREMAQVPLELRQHVPAGATYPFDTVLRPETPLPDHPHWLLRVERAESYTKKPGLID